MNIVQILYLHCALWIKHFFSLSPFVCKFQSISRPCTKNGISILLFLFFTAQRLHYNRRSGHFLRHYCSDGNELHCRHYRSHFKRAIDHWCCDAETPLFAAFDYSQRFGRIRIVDSGVGIIFRVICHFRFNFGSKGCGWGSYFEFLGFIWDGDHLHILAVCRRSFPTSQSHLRPLWRASRKRAAPTIPAQHHAECISKCVLTLIRSTFSWSDHINCGSRIIGSSVLCKWRIDLNQHQHKNKLTMQRQNTQTEEIHYQFYSYLIVSSQMTNYGSKNCNCQHIESLKLSI